MYDLFLLFCEIGDLFRMWWCDCNSILYFLWFDLVITYGCDLLRNLVWLVG